MIEWIKTIFKNRPDTSTPITAKWLNDLQDWILSIQNIATNNTTTKLSSGFRYVVNGLYFKPIEDVNWFRNWNLVTIKWYATNPTGSNLIQSGEAKMASFGTSARRNILISNVTSSSTVNIKLAIAQDGRIEINNLSGGDCYLVWVIEGLA